MVNNIHCWILVPFLPPSLLFPLPYSSSVLLPFFFIFPTNHCFPICCSFIPLFLTPFLPIVHHHLQYQQLACSAFLPPPSTSMCLILLPFHAAFPASARPATAVSITAERSGKYNTSFLPPFLPHPTRLSPPFSSGLLSVCEGVCEGKDKTPCRLAGLSLL